MILKKKYSEFYGFEIPLYLLFLFLFLSLFLSHGAGKYSLDRFIFSEKN